MTAVMPEPAGWGNGGSDSAAVVWNGRGHLGSPP